MLSGLLAPGGEAFILQQTAHDIGPPVANGGAHRAMAALRVFVPGQCQAFQKAVIGAVMRPDFHRLGVVVVQVSDEGEAIAALRHRNPAHRFQQIRLAALAQQRAVAGAQRAEGAGGVLAVEGQLIQLFRQRAQDMAVMGKAGAGGPVALSQLGRGIRQLPDRPQQQPRAAEPAQRSGDQDHRQHGEDAGLHHIGAGFGDGQLRHADAHIQIGIRHFGIGDDAGDAVQAGGFHEAFRGRRYHSLEGLRFQQHLADEAFGLGPARNDAAVGIRHADDGFIGQAQAGQDFLCQAEIQGGDDHRLQLVADRHGLRGDHGPALLAARLQHRAEGELPIVQRMLEIRAVGDIAAGAGLGRAADFAFRVRHDDLEICRLHQHQAAQSLIANLRGQHFGKTGKGFKLRFQAAQRDALLLRHAARQYEGLRPQAFALLVAPAFGEVQRKQQGRQRHNRNQDCDAQR